MNPINSPEPTLHDAHDDKPGDSPFVERYFNYTSLSLLLRILGCGVLTASLSILLFQGWGTSSDIARFYTLLGYSAALAAIGLFIGRIMRENKGARTFLALAIGAVAVDFTVLGALTLSVFGDALAAYPAYASWQAPGTADVAIAIGAALLVLAPIAWFAFAVFARQSATRFALLYVACNIALLVPLRSSLAVGMLGLVMVSAILRELVRARRDDPALATREGAIAVGVQFLPLLILLSRNLYFYAADEILMLLTALIAYVMLRQFAGGFRRERAIVDHALVVSAKSAAAFLTALAASSVVAAGSLPAAAIVPVFTLVFAMLCVDMGACSRCYQAEFVRAGAIILTLGFALNLVGFPMLATALACTAAGLAATIYGFSAEQKSVFVLGVIALCSGLLYQLRFVIDMFDMGSWSSLAFVGVLAILVASALERHGASIRHRVVVWRRRFADWDA